MNLKKPKYKSLKIISIQDYLNLIEDLELNGEKISRRKKEWRLLIENNKLVCPFSNKRVAYCSYDFNEPAQTYHWNFYSEDDQLFTIDHIVARSKGGNSCEIDNLQPMLYDYNFQKGAKNMTAFRKEISKKHGAIFVAEYNNLIVGLLTLFIEKNDIEEKEGSYLYISDIVVSGLYRRQGIAQKLMMHAERFAKEHGLKEIRLGVLANNMSALNLYQKKGYKTRIINLSKKLK